MNSVIKQLFQQIETRLFPFHCVLCQSPCEDRLDLCLHCKQHLLSNKSGCSICGLPLPSGDESLICGQCLQHKPAFDQLTCIGYYQGPLQMLLTQFKFYQKLSVSRIMGKVLAERLANNERPEIIIPIPLHIDRLKQRGFNQALEIAKSVSAELSLPINIRLCQRAKATKPQTEVPAKERHHNVRNAFKLKGKCHYRHVAILDDVVTTGSTVNELSKLLRNQGVEKIQIWCAARATPDK